MSTRTNPPKSNAAVGTWPKSCCAYASIPVPSPSATVPINGKGRMVDDSHGQVEARVLIPVPMGKDPDEAQEEKAAEPDGGSATQLVKAGALSAGLRCSASGPGGDHAGPERGLRSMLLGVRVLPGALGALGVFRSVLGALRAGSVALFLAGSASTGMLLGATTLSGTP